MNTRSAAAAATITRRLDDALNICPTKLHFISLTQIETDDAHVLLSASSMNRLEIMFLLFDVDGLRRQ